MYAYLRNIKYVCLLKYTSINLVIWEYIMRRIPLRYLKENSITAMDIYNSSGKLLISKSMKIDKNMMELLHKNKIIYVYIMDESREDIIDDVISPELRREAVLELKKMSYEFSNLTSIKRNKEINNVYIDRKSVV